MNSPSLWRKHHHRFLVRAVAGAITLAVSMCAFALPVLADPSEDTPAVAEEEVYSPVYDIADPAWPVPPEIAAETAVLMDADTGMILYGKEMHRRMYPASTTKLLTCLIAAERLDLSDTITFSEEAVHSVPADGSKIGMDTGETITVEQALYGIMVGSANEVANAVAEKVSGSMEAFADLMNERAAELGCTDSHFVNAHGYHDDNHYTSAHDLAKIACAFLPMTRFLSSAIPQTITSLRQTHSRMTSICRTSTS